MHGGRPEVSIKASGEMFYLALVIAPWPKKGEKFKTAKSGCMIKSNSNCKGARFITRRLWPGIAVPKYNQKKGALVLFGKEAGAPTGVPIVRSQMGPREARTGP